jgi:hypothetical protein
MDAAGGATVREQAKAVAFSSKTNHKPVNVRKGLAKNDSSREGRPVSAELPWTWHRPVSKFRNTHTLTLLLALARTMRTPVAKGRTPHVCCSVAVPSLDQS